MTEPIRCCRLSRRALAAAPIGVASAALLAACAGSGGTGPGGADSGASGSTDGGQTGANGGALATVPASEVPVGGGVVLPASAVVVTQPESGTFAAFSAICTHQGCSVTRVDGKGIYCPCHSSVFDPASGAPTGGPATAPLPTYVATLEGDAVVVTAG